MSQLETQILHQDYLLTCPDGQEAQLLEAVERVDQQFQHMLDTTKLRSRERVGVLLAVNLAFENLELRQQLQALQQQLARYQGTADTLQAEADAERLQSLEAQMVTAQTAAHQLTLRLDQALEADYSVTPAADESTPDASPLPDEAALEDSANTDLDNPSEVALPSTAPENQ